MHRSALAWLMVATGLACVPACSQGGADSPDGRGGPGGGTGTSAPETTAPAPPLPGCSAQPSCDAKATDGSLCRPVCDAACTKTHAHYSFWVNAFEVANTGGLGRHQGISVLAVELAYDDRVRLDASPTPALPASLAWPNPPLPGLPSDIGKAMTDDGALTAFAMCAAPKVILDTPIYDHGRTLVRDEAYAANRVELNHVHGDRDATTAGDTGLAGSGAWETKTTSCLAAITDGYCDSVCGNCSYVVPEAALDPVRHGDWSEPSNRVNGTGSCTGDSSYYGGPGMMSKDSILGNPYPNPFTHCAREGCDSSYETPTLNGLWWSDTAAVSGLYGHNSNADAEAAYRAFSACATPGDFPGDQACAACGKTESAGRQDPCVDQTNTAATWWDRTASLTKDLYPPVGADVGSSLPQGPHCGWASFNVSGM